MLFWSQLKLLVWKNWLLRKRNKLRTITEVLWPLSMIAFVILLHQVGHQNVFPNCYLKAKAMPSAGEVLFMQTFFCTINNTCDTEKNASHHCYNSSVISNVGNAITEAFNLSHSASNFNNYKMEKHIFHFENWMKDIVIVESMMEAVIKQNKQEWNVPHEPIFKNQSLTYSCSDISALHLDEAFNSQSFNSVFTHFDRPNYNTNVMDDISVLSRIKRKIYFAGIIDSLYHFLIKYSSGQTDEDKSITNELNILDYMLCGPNVPKLMSQVASIISSGKKKSRESEEGVTPGGYKYIVEEPEWENDTTPFCNNLMRKLERSYSSRILFRALKPLIRGKLIFTPDAPVVKKIMKNMNKTLSQIKTVIQMIKNAKEAPPRSDSVKFEEIIRRFKNNSSFLKTVIETSVAKILFKNKKKIKDDNTVKDVKRKIYNFVKNLDETIKNWKKFYWRHRDEREFFNVIPYLECIDMNRVILVRTEKEAVRQALYWLNRERLWGLIVFNISSKAEMLPPSLTYKIRTGIERTSDTNRLRDRVYVSHIKRNIIYDLREITGGFAYLQNMIESELIREYTGRKQVPGIYLQQTPYPCHIYDTFRDAITRTFPMFMIISWIFTFCMISKRIVLEKEILLKGTLRIFGVRSTQHWISWFIDAFVPMIVVTTIISVLLVKGGLLPNSNIFVIWMFLTAFALPTITLAFMMSTFFFKSSFAMAVSGMVYFLLYLPYPPIQNFEETIDPDFKVIACLISNVGFGLGCTWIANMEEVGIGAQLDIMNYSPVPGNPITLSLIIKMFLIDSLVYLLLGLYFDNIFQANDFVRHPWYYCFTRSYWFEKQVKGRDYSRNYTDQQVTNPKYFETGNENLPIGIEAINLSKEFGKGKKKKRVVRNLTINFYENQITSFLGHNGAGKTTAVSMMIGLLPITEGTVRIYGKDIKTNPNYVTKYIGVCRQENVLLDDLTVEEHLRFFAKLKNRSTSDVESDIKTLLRDLNLGKKANKPVKILSGGMKRKVCVALAFVGGSRTVFLDEPTAGIDPHARRSIWELMLKYKKGRTIVLTTHFLDEADILGDRIAIISSGTLLCCGSSIFLKSLFGKGYYLIIESNVRSVNIIERNKEAGDDYVLPVQVRELIDLIKRIVPPAEFHQQIGSEIMFLLPLSVQPDQYITLFNLLQEKKEELNFNSYGIAGTSLEEVFIDVLTDAKKKETNWDEKLTNKNKAGSNEDNIQEINDHDQKQTKWRIARKRNNSEKIYQMSTGKMIKEHCIALLIKRFLHYHRNFKVILIELFLPTFFISIALTLSITVPSVSEMPPLTIDISAYHSTSLFYTNNFPENSRISSYEKSFLSSLSFGTKCVLSPEKCSLRDIPKGSLIANEEVEDVKNCTCTRGFFECSIDNNLKEPPNTKASADFILYNMTGLNLTNWLIATEFEKSKQRLGGISFGHFAPLTGISVREFLNLFMFEKFLQILKSFVVDANILIDPNIFTLLIMTTSCNKSYGEQLLRDKDFEDNIIIWYNNRAWIASLALMNGVANVVLRASLPKEKNPSNYSITLINHPLPITKRQLEDQIELQTNIALISALSVIWALSFIPAMYAVYLVEEKASGLKNLQIVSGLSRIVYWCTNLIWDLISYSISVLAIIVLYIIFQQDEFIGQETIGLFIILLYSYGFVNITFVYMVSFIFSVPSTAFIIIACWNILSGVTTLLITFTLSLISNEKDPYYLNSMFLVFPQFCFGKSLINMALEGIRKNSLEAFGIKSVNNYFDWNFSLKYVMIMLVFGIMYFIITLLIEYQTIPHFVIDKCLKKNIRQKSQVQNNYDVSEDDDVKKERERVESGKAKNDNDVLIINNLTKFYSRKEPPAVNHISVGVKRGECFGLLGMNGAGKTTVFKMLTGYILPTEGDATIGGYSITTDPLKTKLLIGYCPQINALDPYLTAEEHLSFFCRIRGVTGRKKNHEISLNIKRLGLSDQRNKIVKKLSGGNKRKVNAAIALVCDPELVLLDEPTSGMDVLSRRFLWNCLQEVVLEGRCVVLTSHSMEECQALCTHLSIMVNGKFSCFGTCQHLKNKFNEGYIVSVRLYNVEAVEIVKNLLETNFPDSSFLHVHDKVIKYKINSNIFIGTIFQTLCKAKEEKVIQDYIISQTTLENIFLKLAKDSENA